MGKCHYGSGKSGALGGGTGHARGKPMASGPAAGPIPKASVASQMLDRVAGLSQNAVSPDRQAQRAVVSSSRTGKGLPLNDQPRRIVSAPKTNAPPFVAPPTDRTPPKTTHAEAIRRHRKGFVR